MISEEESQPSNLTVAEAEYLNACTQKKLVQGNLNPECKRVLIMEDSIFKDMSNSRSSH